MSIFQSNLSAFGYDIVVATTPAGINATMKEFLHNSHLPVVKKYYVKGSDSKPEEIDYKTLMDRTDNTDPLDGENWKTTPRDKKKIDNLAKAKFLCAFEAEIGLPAHVDPGNVPAVIELNNVEPGFVRFRLLCARFTIVQASYDGDQITDFLYQSQTPDDLWTFTSEVRLKLVNGVTELPEVVKRGAMALGEDFSVQKLILDLDNAIKGQVPEINGVVKDSPVYKALDDVFVKTYLNSLKSGGEPALNYVVMLKTSDPSTLKITSTDKGISRFVDSNGQVVKDRAEDHPNLYTLNYFCATNNNKLPPPVQFPWNWPDNTASDSQLHGAIAINRNTLAHYFHGQMYEQISNMCLVPKPIVKTGGGGLNYTVDFSSDRPEVVFQQAGSTVVSYSFQRDAIDYAGAGGTLGHIITNTRLNISVEFNGTSIIISQSLLIHFGMSHWFWTAGFGLDIVDVTITDTYTLKGADNAGNLIMQCSSGKADRFDSNAPCLKTSYKDEVYDLKTKIEKMLSEKFKSIQLSLMKTFVFPAAGTFSFTNVCFSEHQDLVANIIYTKPR